MLEVSGTYLVHLRHVRGGGGGHNQGMGGEHLPMANSFRWNPPPPPIPNKMRHKVDAHATRIGMEEQKKCTVAGIHGYYPRSLFPYQGRLRGVAIWGRREHAEHDTRTNTR